MLFCSFLLLPRGSVGLFPLRPGRPRSSQSTKKFLNAFFLSLNVCFFSSQRLLKTQDRVERGGATRQPLREQVAHVLLGTGAFWGVDRRASSGLPAPVPRRTAASAALQGPAAARGLAALRGPRSSRGPSDVEWGDDRLMEFSTSTVSPRSSPPPHREDLDWSRGPSTFPSSFLPSPTSYLHQDQVEVEVETRRFPI